MSKPALGRGLGALLGNAPSSAKPVLPPVPAAPVAAPAPVDTQERVQRVALHQIHPCPLQPRKEFTPEALQELADSIRQQGIIQPLIVRKKAEGLELIAGERRWRAAQLLGLTDIPVIVREADDRSVLELALIENLQRENLNPIEEAHGYAELIEKFSLRQEDVASKVGKSRVVVANALRLLKLPSEVQGYLRSGLLTVGHAKVILGLNSEADEKLAAERVVKKGLNVRQTEELVAHWQKTAAGSSGRGAAPLPDSNVAALENRLREKLGTQVQLRYRQGKGSLEIRFFSDAELERVLQILGVPPE